MKTSSISQSVTLAIFLAIQAGLLSAETDISSQKSEAVEAFFSSSEPFVRETVLPNIEKYRKSDCTLEFVDAKGAPLQNLRVTAQLKRHQFLFGACPPETKAQMDPRFLAAWSELFNFGVPANATKWSSVEGIQGKYNFGGVDKMVDLCSKYGVTLEYHFLTGYHPAWLASLPVEERAKSQQEYARAVVQRYQGKISLFQVYNEDWLTHIERAGVCFDQTEFFQQLVKEFPEVKFGISDCWSLDESAPFPDVDTLKSRYPGISFLSIHAHMPRCIWASPDQMYQNFDKYIDSDVKIHITEFGINSGPIDGTYRQGEWTEELKADYFVQAYAVAFSHPAVDAINHWEIGPGKGFLTFNALLNGDYSPKPAYLALKDLIRRKLSTTVEGTSNQAGQYQFRGFHGQYEVTVEDQSGQRRTFSFELAPNSTRHRLGEAFHFLL